MSTDRIEKQVRLRAPRSRVWTAITDPRQFGSWFRVALEGPFEAGRTTRGRITYPGYEHLTIEMDVVAIEPERSFSYRWRPYAVDPNADYSAEPKTLVDFRLDDAPGGDTLLTITESGFDAIPAGRRAEAYRMNEGGWTEQTENVRRHVEGS